MTKNPLGLMNELIFSKWKIRANHFRRAPTHLEVLALYFIGNGAHRAVDQSVLPVSIVADHIKDPDMADRISQGPKAAGQAANLCDRLLARGDRCGIEGDPDRVGIRTGRSAGVRLDPAMGMFLAHDQVSGELVPVATLEAVDDSRLDAHRAKQEGKRGREILTVT